MKISLIGCGCGRETLVREAAEAIRSADALIGAPRLLEQFPEAEKKIPALSAKEIATALPSLSGSEVCVLFSGDSGFYSGARLLIPLLPVFFGMAVSIPFLFVLRFRFPFFALRFISYYIRRCPTNVQQSSGAIF